MQTLMSVNSVTEPIVYPIATSPIIIFIYPSDHFHIRTTTLLELIFLIIQQYILKVIFEG